MIPSKMASWRLFTLDHTKILYVKYHIGTHSPGNPLTGEGLLYL